MFHYRAPIAGDTMHGTGIDACILTAPAMLGYAVAKHYLRGVDVDKLITSASHRLQAGAAPCVQLAWEAKAAMEYLFAERDKLMRERVALYTRIAELQAKDDNQDQSSRKRLKGEEENNAKRAKQQVDVDTESDNSSHNDYRAEELSIVEENMPELEEVSQTSTVFDNEEDNEVEEIVSVNKQVKVGDFIELKQRVWSPYGHVGRVVEINQAKRRYRILFNFAWNPKLWCREEDLVL